MGTHPAKILIMEDNAADVLLLRLALDHHKEDYELEVLRDGEEAIRFVEQQRTLAAGQEPCVIVLDLNLPRHDGKAVLRAIKQEPTLSHIHVVMLSSLASPKDQMEVQRLGVRLYKTKPMVLDDWITLAREILAICREPIEITVA